MLVLETNSLYQNVLDLNMYKSRLLAGNCNRQMLILSLRCFIWFYRFYCFFNYYINFFTCTTFKEQTKTESKNEKQKDKKENIQTEHFFRIRQNTNEVKQR